MSKKLGLEMKLFRNSGTPGSETPTWVEIGNVRDLTTPLEKGEADMTTRGAQGWEIVRATLKSGSVDFNILYDPEDDDYTYFESAFMDNTFADIAVCDDEGNGIRFVGDVFNFNRNEQLREAVSIDVSVRPSDPDNPPEVVTGVGGS
jgi:hypothetical protein